MAKIKIAQTEATKTKREVLSERIDAAKSVADLKDILKELVEQMEPEQRQAIRSTINNRTRIKP